MNIKNEFNFLFQMRILIKTVVEVGANLIRFSLRHPKEAISFLIILQFLSENANAEVLFQKPQTFDAVSLDKCFNYDPNQKSVFFKPTCRALKRNVDKFSLEATQNEKQLHVYLLGENHEQTFIPLLANTMFPFLIEKNYTNFVFEDYSDFFQKENIIKRFPRKRLDHKEMIRLFDNIFKHSLKYYPIEEDKNKIYSSKERHYSEFYNFILNSLDDRDQMMAVKIVKILKKTKKNVFGIIGEAHAGVAKYLLKAGYKVTFVTFDHNFTTNIIESQLRGYLKQIQKELDNLKHPNFKYYKIPKDYIINIEANLKFKKLIIESLTVNNSESQAKLSLFWELYRLDAEHSFMDKYSLKNIESNSLPSWNSIAQDLNKKRWFFFPSNSEHYLKKLKYINHKNECVEPEDLCTAIKESSSL